jgi:hypothetical protein
MGWLQGEQTMKKRTGIILLTVIVLCVAWYEFRPELLFLNKRMEETVPVQNVGSIEALSSGQFHSIIHETKGTATVYMTADGSRILRFTNFSTSNGPDVHIYLVALSDANDSASVERAGFLDLGQIKGNIGDQEYTLAPSIDLSKYRAVSVWCKRFSLNFGTAPLQPAEPGVDK